MSSTLPFLCRRSKAIFLVCLSCCNFSSVPLMFSCVPLNSLSRMAPERAKHTAVACISTHRNYLLSASRSLPEASASIFTISSSPYLCRTVAHRNYLLLSRSLPEASASIFTISSSPYLCRTVALEFTDLIKFVCNNDKLPSSFWM